LGCIELTFLEKKASSWEWGKAAGRCRAEKREPRQLSRVPSRPFSNAWAPDLQPSMKVRCRGAGAESPNQIGVSLSLTGSGRCAGSRSTEPPAFVVARILLCPDSVAANSNRTRVP